MGRPCVIALVVALLSAASASAANPYGPGCDPARAVVAHHAGGAVVEGAAGPVACVTETGYASSESTLTVTPSGAAFYSPAHTENSMTRSTDEGASWQLTYPGVQQYTALWNTVDPQVTVDRRTGRVFWIHATGDLRTAPFLVSQSPLPWEATTVVAYAAGFQVYSTPDDGRTWTTADYSHESMGDWEKVFVGPPPPSPASGAEQPKGYPDVVYACANSPFEVSGPGRLCYRSLDGGASFARAGYVFPAPGSPVDSCPALATNTGVVGNDGTIYQPVSCSSGAFVAVSHDEGATYEWLAVRDAPASSGLSGALQIVIDRDDILYAIWKADDAVRLAVSRDRARTWGKPMTVTAPGVKSVTFPAPAAGGRGEVGVAYYGSTKASPPALTAYVTATDDALAAEPVFHSAALNDPGTPVFHDYGFDATPRADYVGAAFDPSGALWAGMVKQLGRPDADQRIKTTGLVGRLVPVSGPAPPGGATLTGGAAKGCLARRRLTFRLGAVARGRVVRAVVFVNGRRLLTARGRDLRRIGFARPRGARLVVRIVTTNNGRGRVVTVRTYRGCARGPLRTRHERRRKAN